MKLFKFLILLCSFVFQNQVFSECGQPSNVYDQYRCTGDEQHVCSTSRCYCKPCKVVVSSKTPIQR